MPTDRTAVLRLVGPGKRAPRPLRRTGAASPVVADPAPDPAEVLTAAEASIFLGISEDAVLARQREGLISATPTLAELAPDAALDEHAAAFGHHAPHPDQCHDEDEPQDAGFDIEATPDGRGADQRR